MEKQTQCCLDFLMHHKNIVVQQKEIKIDIKAFSFIHEDSSYIVINQRFVTNDIDLLNTIIHQLISLKSRLIHPTEHDSLLQGEEKSNSIYLSYLISNIMSIVG